MTRDEVVKMAVDCLLITRIVAESSGIYADALVDFAELVAAAEREECAKVCDGIGAAHHKAYKGKDPSREQDRFSKYVEGACDGADECADAIRARKGGA